jgi:hypothetical protein
VIALLRPRLGQDSEGGARHWYGIFIGCDDDQWSSSRYLGHRTHAVISQDILDHLLHIIVDPLPLLVGHADAETIAHRHVQLIDQPGRKPADHGASFALAAQLTSART